jgi:serine/threonine-protein kinase HipA
MVARVKIWNTLVGAVLWDNTNGYSRFEFDESFLKKGLDISPLKMPLNESINGKKTYAFPSLSY